MIQRLAMMCLLTMLLIAADSPSGSAQDNEQARASLKDMDAVAVLVTVEGATDVTNGLGLTKEAIQTRTEVRLQLEGMRVVTLQEASQPTGMPTLHIDLSMTDRAARIDVELQQNVRLERNGQPAIGVITWRISDLLANPSAQNIRNGIELKVDEFLNAWHSVSPKK
jgi:hypothetical protein